MRETQGREDRPRGPVYKVGILRVDSASRRAWVGNRLVEELTPTEYAILEALVLAKGALVSYDQLLDAAHDPDSEFTPCTLKRHVSRIRVKLRGAGADGECLRCFDRYGYSLEPGLLRRQAPRPTAPASKVESG